MREKFNGLMNESMINNHECQGINLKLIDHMNECLNE